ATRRAKPGEAPAPKVPTEITEEREALLDRLARAQADFENTRRRLAKEQEDFKEFALTDSLKSLLPVLDSFDWALQTPAQNARGLPLRSRAHPQAVARGFKQAWCRTDHGYRRTLRPARPRGGRD